MNNATVHFPTDVIIRCDPDQARHLQEGIERDLRLHRYNDHEIFGIKLAVEEAIVNAMKHGNHMDPAKRLRIAYQVNDQRFDILIADEGSGFNPAEVPDPTAIENLERPSGRGLMLMRHYMTEVNYNKCGNSVTMSMLRNGSVPRKTGRERGEEQPAED